MNKIDFLKIKLDEIKNKYLGTYLNKIQEITSQDFVFNFSKNKDNSLFFSLTPQNPFVEITSLKFKESLNSLFLNSLKTKLLQACLINIQIINNDSLIDFTFSKTTDTYEKKQYHLLFEAYKANSNLVLLENNKILLAYRYHSLETNHPIIINTTYLPLENNYVLKEINFEEENFKINNYLNLINQKHLKEKYNFLISRLKRKKKSLENKLKNLLEENLKAKKNLIYKEYGDYFLTIMNDIKKGDKYFIYNDTKIPLKENYSISSNLEYLYKVYKKAKSALKMNESFINETKDELDYISSILDTKDNLNNEDYEELIKELEDKNIIKIKSKIKKKDDKAYLPYYFIYKDTKIAFGKNNLQNNNLTFNLAKKDYYYLHILNYHGSHVVIFNNKLDDEILEVALETVLFLSKKDSIDVLVSQIKDCKKSNTLGLVNVLKYESYHINYCKDEIKELIKNATRFLR